MSADRVGMGRLFELGSALVPRPDLEAVLPGILEAAREITGARFAALGILDEGGSELAEFRTAGVAEETRRRIGNPPRGHRVLGVLISDPRPRRLADVETTVYRLVQEAPTDVAKHARARVARVSVVACGKDVEVEVRDDGVGFGAEARTSGFGLAGMRERVYLAGGTLTIESSARGTRVRARLSADPQARGPGARTARRLSGGSR